MESDPNQLRIPDLDRIRKNHLHRTRPVPQHLQRVLRRIGESPLLTQPKRLLTALREILLAPQTQPHERHLHTRRGHQPYSIEAGIRGKQRRTEEQRKLGRSSGGEIPLRGDLSHDTSGNGRGEVERDPVQFGEPIRYIGEQSGFDHRILPRTGGCHLVAGGYVGSTPSAPVGPRHPFGHHVSPGEPGQSVPSQLRNLFPLPVEEVLHLVEFVAGPGADLYAGTFRRLPLPLDRRQVSRSAQFDETGGQYPLRHVSPAVNLDLIDPHQVARRHVSEQEESELSQGEGVPETTCAGRDMRSRRGRQGRPDQASVRRSGPVRPHEQIPQERKRSSEPGRGMNDMDRIDPEHGAEVHDQRGLLRKRRLKCPRPPLLEVCPVEQVRGCRARAGEIQAASAVQNPRPEVIPLRTYRHLAQPGMLPTVVLNRSAFLRRETLVFLSRHRHLFPGERLNGIPNGTPVLRRQTLVLPPCHLLRVIPHAARNHNPDVLYRGSGPLLCSLLHRLQFIPKHALFPARPGRTTDQSVPHQFASKEGLSSV